MWATLAVAQLLESHQLTGDVQYMYNIYVQYIRTVYMYSIHVQYTCTVYMYSIHVQYMYSIHVQYMYMYT